MLKKLPLMLASASFLAGATGILALGKPVPGYLLVPLEEVAPFQSAQDLAASQAVLQPSPPSVIFPDDLLTGVTAASLPEPRAITPPVFARALPPTAAPSTPAAIPVSMPVDRPAVDPIAAPAPPIAKGTPPAPAPDPGFVAAAAANRPTVVPLVRNVEAETPKETPTPKPTPSPARPTVPTVTPTPAPRVVSPPARPQTSEHGQEKHEDDREGHGSRDSGPKKVTVQFSVHDRSRGRDD